VFDIVHEKKMREKKGMPMDSSRSFRNVPFSYILVGYCPSRETYRRDTEKRLEEAKVRREAKEKEKATQRYTRKEHKRALLLFPNVMDSIHSRRTALTQSCWTRTPSVREAGCAKPGDAVSLCL